MTNSSYDPLDFETWPEEQIHEIGRVWESLEEGDLKPLADYLRAGKYIPAPIGAEIANAIEGNSTATFRIYARRRGRGVRTMKEEGILHDRRMRIGVYVEQHIREAGKGGYETAITAAMDQFNISRKTANDARNYLLEMIERPDNVTTWETAIADWYNPNS